MNTNSDYYGDSFLYVLVGLGVLIGLLILLFAPFTTHGVTSEVNRYTTREESSKYMELGDQAISTKGVDGIDAVTYRSTGSLIQRMFAEGELLKEELDREVSLAPVEKVITKGTLKYQYMHCSDGSYRYYSDDQFRNAHTGFTSKSEDSCKLNGSGVKVRLSASPPAQSYDNSYSYSYGYDLDCADVGYEHYVGYDDPNGLDGDGDGWACEGW